LHKTFYATIITGLSAQNRTTFIFFLPLFPFTYIMGEKRAIYKTARQFNIDMHDSDNSSNIT